MKASLGQSVALLVSHAVALPFYFVVVIFPILI